MADEEKAAEETTEEQPEKKGGPGIVGMVLPALLAAGGAFGGAFLAAPAPSPAAEEAPVQPTNTPGPTVPLMPFVLNVKDEGGEVHAMKITLAIELEPETDPAAFEVFVPRIRDSCLTYLRSMTYEEAADSRSKEKMTQDLIAQIEKLGAEMAKEVLVQDFVMQ